MGGFGIFGKIENIWEKLAEKKTTIETPKINYLKKLLIR